MPSPDQIEAQRADALAIVQDYIREGGYAAGDKLPPERQLVDQLGLTRGTLRAALESLERSGAIWRHVGKGTFISERMPDPSAALDGLVNMGRQMTPMRMMQARLCLEPALAREAAVHATGEAITAMEQARQRSRAAATWAEYEAQDDRFHRTVAEAADNVLLLTFFDQLNRVRRAVTWGSVERRNVRPAADHSSFDEHAAITRAISERDPDRAWSTMREHLKSVSARLFP